jgi:flagellar hook-length control protein FliK
MNRLVLQQQTALSLTAERNPLVERASSKLQSPSAKPSRKLEVPADRPAVFAHTLHRKSKAAAAEHETSTARDAARRDDPANSKSNASQGTPRTDKVPDTRLQDKTDTAASNPDAASTAADDSRASGEDAQSDPRAASDPNAPKDGNGEVAAPPAPQPISPSPPAAGIEHSPTAASSAASQMAAGAVQKPAEQSADSRGGASEQVAQQGSVAVTTPTSSQLVASAASAAKTADAASPKATRDPRSATAKVVGNTPAQDLLVQQTPNATAAPAPSAASQKPSPSSRSDATASANVKPGSPPNAAANGQEDEESQSALAESGPPVAETESVPSPTTGRPIGRTSAGADAGRDGDDPGTAPGAALAQPKATSHEPLLQTISIAHPASNAPTSPSESRESTQISPSLTASSRAMDLLGRLVSEPAAASGNAPPPGAAASPEFQRALQAQVERGIEQAAQQAAASGAWTGVGTAGSSSVTLRLHPANLGMMRVYLRMDAGTNGSGGGVKARFEVSSSRTKGILGSSIESLRTALRDRGLTVDEVSVTDMPKMPERDVGLPPVAESAHDGGAAFAGNQRQGGPDGAPSLGRGGDGSASGAREGSAAEPGGDSHNGQVNGMWEGGGRPVTLAALSARSSPLTIGEDGRVSVNALV